MLLEDQLRAGAAAHQAGRLDEAEQHYKAVLKAERHNFTAARLLGMLYIQRQDFAQAETFLARANKANPGDASTQQNHAAMLLALKRSEEAIAAADRALALQDGNLAALHVKISALMELERYGEAIASADQALKLDQNYVEGWYMRGNALYQTGRYGDALANYDKVLTQQPGRFEALYYRASSLAQMERHAEAIAAFDRAISVNAQYADAFYERGTALGTQSRLKEAIADYSRALALKPDFMAAWNSRGTANLMLGRAGDALADLDRALALKPDEADAWKKRGGALDRLHRPEEALESYRRGVALTPDDAATYVDIASLLQHADRPQEALAAFDTAATLNPGAPYLAGGRLNLKMHMCDWRDFEGECQALLLRVAEGEPAGMPFTLLPIASTPAQQFAAAWTHIKDKHPAIEPGLRSGVRYTHECIRIAYLSTDYRAHATAVLATELFEQHDRARFDITAISLGPNDHSPYRARLESAFDHFIEARDMSDEQIAAAIAEHEIDIAVDLNGHTQGVRLGVFARRPAPLQVNYLGYPGTSGADYMDYLIADRVLIPSEDEIFYAEKIAALPFSYQPNSRRDVAANMPSRASCELPQDGFVFCSFNNTFKITPDIFAVWMRLLKAVDGSVLWLLEPIKAAQENLRREAEAHGVNAERLVFAPRLAVAEHLARQQLADLFLDTLYYNAHTTASDALWSGVPLLTCQGHAFAARVAASVLSAIDMPELITNSLDAYEALALRLARDPAHLVALKTKLKDNKSRTALFDIKDYTRDLERAYQTMWQRHQKGLAPESFTLER